MLWVGGGGLKGPADELKRDPLVGTGEVFADDEPLDQCGGRFDYRRTQRQPQNHWKKGPGPGLTSGVPGISVGRADASTNCFCSPARLMLLNA